MHNHYVHTCRKEGDPTRMAYRWGLQTKPVNPSTITLTPVSNNNLSIFNADHTEATQVSQHGSLQPQITDVDIYRDLEEKGAMLRIQQAQLDRDFSDWCYKYSPVHEHLVKARVHSHIHPYLDNQIPIPHPYDTHPLTCQENTLTIADATTMYRDELIEWLPRP